MQRKVLLCIVLVQFGTWLSLGNAAAVKFKDCDHVRAAGFVKNQTYTVWMNDTTSFKIRCEHGISTSNAVIMMRLNGTENFNRSWRDYQRGFGNPKFNHWLGLDKIHYLTSRGYNILTVNMLDWYAVLKSVRYFHFNVSSAPNFQLSIRDYLGQVPDDLLYNHGMNFATYDKGEFDYNDCAQKLRAGWWYNDCTYALPTGVYYPGGDYSPKGGFYDGMFWKDWRGYGYSLKVMRMVLSTSV
ncbi:angiopoietin-related protein 1-like [Saccostrea echinata]|uniref:angiopoietin-related protein 1-like n=1 Tax=Saccostrea echinata TaxID=191078 RepID=UPI002A805373|nr:angiopoietin-related protein 1-like [Saccostrea echinata]